MRVGDLGCGGVGHLLFPTAALVGPKGIVYAVDVQKNVLQAIESRRKIEGAANIELVWSNLEVVGGTNIKEASLDSGMIVNVLFQNKKHRNVLEEAARLLKSKAKLIVIDWKATGAPFGPNPSLRVAPDEIETLAASVGFRLLDRFDAGPYHFGLIFEKL
jgi:ubiquinone/menaquinone biosynthesis C-methylase UbiE